MKIKAFYLLLILGLIPAVSQAGVITQSINYQYKPWSPTNYFDPGYITFNHSLGDLTGVRVETQLSGSKLSAESLFFEYGFYTGTSNPWGYRSTVPIGQSDFTYYKNELLTDSFITQRFSDLTYPPIYPDRHFYFYSLSDSINYFISGTTTLTYYYNPPVSVPESASMYLMTLGLLGFGAFRKFNKNAKRAE